VSRSNVRLFIDPFSRRNEQDRLFDPSTAPDAGDNAFEPFAYLRSWLEARGIEVHTADMLDGSTPNEHTSVYLSFGQRQRYPRLARRSDTVLSGFFAFECPVVLPALYADLHKIDRSFKRVFSFSTEQALQPFLRGRVQLRRFMLPQSFDDVHAGKWERGSRRFLVMITGNKLTRVDINELYTERLRALEFFNRYDEIDLYGRDWEQPAVLMASRIPRAVARFGRRLGARWESVYAPKDPLRVAVRQVYRGPAIDKADVMSRYTFAVCFENMTLEGWITEKIFDCFYAGTVPIYLGAPDIERWVPAECFIDMRGFDGYEELREFLYSLSANQIEAYRVAARDFLRSEQFRPFSKQTFAELIGRIVEEDTGVSL
jgi:hypothetical protein